VSPSEPLCPQVGWGVVHLFWHAGPAVEAEAAVSAVKAARLGGDQVVTVALLGHKADLCVMALGPDLRRLRRLQTELRRSGLVPAGSYVSLTEVSEYAQGIPEEMRQARLYPRLPPEGMSSFCFYPMSKRRAGERNWYALGYEERLELMASHGAVGRRFRGRVLQLVTGSVGLDDWEWGVTLFARRPDDLKECVYQMRFDPASAHYAEFGPFWSGMVGEVEDVLGEVLGR
jgi:peroxiredoxin